MYDEFVKELRDAENYAKEVGTNPYRFVPYYGKAADTIEKLIEVIQNHDFLENLVKPRWIPVE